MVEHLRIGIAALIVWIVAGMIAWATFSVPDATKLVSVAKRDTLSMLSAPTSLKPDVDALAGKDLWGFNNQQTLAATAAALPVERWIRIAIVKEAKDTYILLQSPGNEVKSFRAGDTLPDGSKLITVSAAEVVTRPAKGKPQTFRLMD